MRRIALVLGLAAVGFGLPSAILYGYSVLMSSSFFALSYVDVEGLEYLEEDTLLKAAQAVAGEHLLNVRSEHLEEIFAGLPFVARVSVERRFPDRLHIEIEEHEPAAVIVDDGFWLADVYGDVFLELDDPDPGFELWDLPLISGLTRADLTTERGKERLLEARRVYRMYGERGLAERQPISEVHIEERLGLSLIVGEAGMEVRLGWGRWEERLDRLEVIQESLIRRGVEATYVLLDQEEDFNRVAVGRRAGPGNGESGQE